jgi:DNA-binding NarL/FixJ family response regulator
MADKIRLLLACSDPVSRARLADNLNDTEFEAILASDFEESSTVLAKQPVSMVFCEDQLPGGGFTRLLKAVKHSGTSTPVVVLSRTGDWEEYLKALRLGAFDMVIPPYDRVAIHTVAYNALHECRIARGARGVEALSHMPPQSALRASAKSAHGKAFAGPGATQHSAGREFPFGRKEAAAGLPGAKKTGTGEESLSTNSSVPDTQSGFTDGVASPGSQETDRSVSKVKRR